MSGEGPQVFGDYYLLTTLARGGMGSVHLAKRVGFRADIQRFFAVKKLPRGHASERELRRFYDEARVVVTLNHRAVCHVFDVGVVDDEHYLAMELIEGVTLKRALDATKMEQRLALYIVDEMLDALDYAHRHRDPATGEALQIVHRDVSPHNVMLSFQGGVKLIDFGLVSSTLKQERTVGGVIVGKLEYMSPEQARGEPLDARSDVYAAAIIAFEMLSGRRFYEGLSKSALSTAVVEGDHAPSFEGIDAALVPILKRALAAERDDRTASCAALQAELAAFARGSSRELRDALQAALPEEKWRLEELVRSFRDVGTEKEVATSVRHIARSSDSDAPDAPDVSEEPTLITLPNERNTATKLARPAPRERRSPVLAALAGVAAIVVVAIVVVAMWPARDDGAPALDAGIHIEVATVPTPTTTTAVTTTTLPPAQVDAGVEDVAPIVDAQTSAHAHKPVKRVHPPNTALPDLAAHLDYLAQWCARMSCAKPVLASRSRIPLLDVVGLRALRRDAEACVVECRR